MLFFSEAARRGGYGTVKEKEPSRSASAISLLMRGRTNYMGSTTSVPLRFTIDELPIRVREAAIFLGVSPQTVYLWVERKQIPHLRVMGRNIRFLKSELEPFRAQFKQEVENWQDQ
jgi:excisionase family DNA binding protein